MVSYDLLQDGVVTDIYVGTDSDNSEYLTETLMIATKRSVGLDSISVDLYKLKEDWFWEYLRLFKQDAYQGQDASQISLTAGRLVIDQG